MIKKKVIATIVSAVLLSSVLVGCGGNSAVPGRSNTSSNNSITVLVESGSPAETLAIATAEEFKALTGYEVIIDATPYSGMFDKLSTSIRANATTYDVVSLDVLWLSAFEHALLPLDEIATEEITSDFLPTLQDGGTLHGNLLGFPMWINAKVLIYRSDLFRDDIQRENFKEEYGRELTVPTTWDEFKEVAKFFTTDDMFGTAVFGAASGDTVCSFLDHASQAGAKPLVLDENNNVLIDTQAYIDALQFQLDLIEAGVVPQETLSIASTESQELFNNGRIAMQLNWSHQFPAANALNEGNVGVAPMIGGSAGVAAVAGPWYQSVMKNSENIEIAKQYVLFMFENNYRYMTEGSLRIAGRISVYEEFATIPGNEHLTAVLETLDNAYSQNRPNTPFWKEIEEVLARAIQAGLSGNNTPEGALQDARVAIEAILSR